MPAEKNTFVRFAKIPIPPIITLVGKMPNHKFDLDPQGMGPEEGWSNNGPSTPAMDTAMEMQECRDGEDWEEEGDASSSSFPDFMDKMRTKFAQYEQEDQEAGLTRSFLHYPGENPEEEEVCPTTGACAGFGFKQGDQFYVNENLRCGDRGKQSMATILVYLALHYCDLDSRGFCQYGNTRDIAGLTGLTVRTVRNSVWKLAKADYIDAGGIDRDGDFVFREPDYEKIGLTYIEGGRGYLNLEEGMLRQLAAMRDVNALRMALRMLITVDNPRSDGTAIVREKDIRSFLPKYVTKGKLQESIDMIRKMCGFLQIGASQGKRFFSVSLPEEQDAKRRRAEADRENREKLGEYIPQLVSLYNKEYDAADEYHRKYGKFPQRFQVFGYEKENLDKEFIFKADEEESAQYASMATQYGLGIVKQALAYLAREISVLRRWIDCKPAYLRQLIRNHPDGIFAHGGAC